MTQLNVHTRALPCGPVMTMAGELDHHSAPEVRDLLPGLSLVTGQRLLVDLGGLTFCDSSGITVLLAARNHALAARATIALIAVPDRVRRIFSIVGLEQVFPTYPTVQEAAAAWTPPAAG
ncbi:STAS domain-containing protein [Streptomyces laculatispora]|uniref:STAS domain-containing protein n=1 Tax=Streptomyces laculatispora TaxID=887464 RepID=UPI0027DD9295|nr:STAS domain-containing protein [Streptomyces laculatispora]